MLTDGTYQYTLTPRMGAGIQIKATVSSGVVVAWERNTLPALPSEFECIDFTAALTAELTERARLAGLLAPIKFTPAVKGVVAA